MKMILKRMGTFAALCAAAAALAVTGQGALASAATARHAASNVFTPSTQQIAVAIPMTRGTHAVSGEMPVTSELQATLDRSAHMNLGPAVPDQENIAVRVGKNNCGGFNGEYALIVIGEVQGLPLWGMEFYGTEWDNCDYYTPNTTVYTYVKWTAVGITSNTQLEPPASGNSVGINQTISVGIVTPGPVYVTACLKWNNGWGCGPSQKM